MSPEAIQIDEYINDGFAMSARNEIGESDLVRIALWLDHVVDLVLDVAKVHRLVIVALELPLNGPEEVVEVERVEVAFVVDVQDSE